MTPLGKGKIIFLLHLTLKNVKSIPSLEFVLKADSGPGVAPGPQFANPRPTQMAIPVVRPSRIYYT